LHWIRSKFDAGYARIADIGRAQFVTLYSAVEVQYGSHINKIRRRLVVSFVLRHLLLTLNFKAGQMIILCLKHSVYA
jgi:hypothetical protein